MTICPSNTSLRPGSLRASPTILVVEDEVLVRLWVTDELRGNGFTVLEATNGDEALQVLNSSEAVFRADRGSNNKRVARPARNPKLPRKLKACG